MSRSHSSVIFLVVFFFSFAMGVDLTLRIDNYGEIAQIQPGTRERNRLVSQLISALAYG